MKLATAMALLILLGACQQTHYCHPSLVEEDGGGMYFQRDDDGGGIYFNRDGGGVYVQRDETDERRQEICRPGVEAPPPEAAPVADGAG